MLRVHEVSGSIPETDRRFALANASLVGPMDKATAYGAVDSGFESQAGLGPPFGGAPIKIGTIQRRLAWPLRKDDTHKSRWYRYFFTDTVAERLRRWTRNPLGFSRMSSNLIGVVFVKTFFVLPASLPERSKGLRSGRNVFVLVGSNPTACNRRPY